MNPSNEYIKHICDLYNDYYDDRIEESNPPTAGNNPKTAGEDWRPGVLAAHKSLVAFQKELEEEGIRLSTSKIKKILVTGGCWTTARSRQVQELYDRYTKEGVRDEDDPDTAGKILTAAEAVERISKELRISKVSVSVNIPYQDVVYKLEQRSKNAIRCARYRKKKRG
jgi:hypothetical protein